MAERHAGTLMLCRNGFCGNRHGLPTRSFSVWIQKGGVVATYRATTMAISKDGELCIYPVRNPSLSAYCPFTRRDGSRVNS